METATRRNRWVERLFTLLMRRTLDEWFRFPGGGLARRAVDGCMEVLAGGAEAPSREKVVDFCVCQVYALTFDAKMLRGWTPAHSFGRKALERFARNTSTHRYWEDRWLKEHGLARGGLLHEVRDRSQHPLAKFLYPEYEDATKRRRIGTEAGLYVCSLSTLLWTPLSPVCQECAMTEKCREMTCERYPELYRLRVEHGKQGGRS